MIQNRECRLMLAPRKLIERLRLAQHDLGLFAQLRRLSRRRRFAEFADHRLQARSIAEIHGAQSEREQFLDVVERRLPFHLGPAFALDDVARAHRAAIVPEGGFPTASPNLALLAIPMPTGV